MLKNLPANEGDTGEVGLIPWLGRSPGGGLGDPANIPVFMPGEPHGQGSLVGYSPWGCTDSDMTEAT